MKRAGIAAIFLSPLFLFSFATVPRADSPQVIKVKKVVIDAGHGGHDPGAVGKKYKESHIALAIALKLGDYIKLNMPEVEVIYTRKTDVFVELHKRARTANESKADLFISIHCNSTKTSTPYGTETWVMGLNKSEANLEVAKKENSTILMEADYSDRYDGFDPNSPEAYIIFSLYQNIYLEQSLNLAAKIESQFTHKAGRQSRGVKQAGFLVLYKTTMPGVLVETGFISNAEEETFMASENGQAIIASAIYRAIREYKNEVEGIVPAKKDSLIHPPMRETQLPQAADTTAKVIEHPVKEPKPKDTSAARPAFADTAGGIYFRVQFATSTSQKKLDSPAFKGLNGVREYFHNGLYKYTVGNEKSLEDATALLRDIHTRGFRDAFVVAFVDEKRITPAEAVELLKKQRK